MSLEVWLAYVGLVLLLMSTPGPSQLLMLASSMSNGFRRSTATAAGDLTANVLQMLAAGLGLGALVVASEATFTVIKWLGVSYLIWIGIRKFRGADQRAVRMGTRRPLRALWSEGFITSAANPKAVVFFAALFPQFIDRTGSFWIQFLILSGTYVFLDAAFLSVYGAGASWIAQRVQPSAKRLNQLAGSLLLGAAILLGLKMASRS